MEIVFKLAARIWTKNVILLSVQSSLSIINQNYLRKCNNTYFIIQNKYLHIYEDSFGTKILRDDCAHSIWRLVILVRVCIALIMTSVWNFFSKQTLKTCLLANILLFLEVHTANTFVYCCCSSSALWTLD